MIMAIQSINPASGEILKTFEEFGNLQIDAAIAAADAAFRTWSPDDRITEISSLTSLVDELERTRKISARLMVMEVGKTIKAANAEIDKCIDYCEYWIENAQNLFNDRIVETEHKKAYTTVQPLGAVLLIMPWNFPFWQVIRVAIPALLAGNSVLLKHASNVPQCALQLETIFKATKHRAGAFQTLLINSEQIEPLLEDDRIKAVSLTGSEAAGAAVASKCGQNIKKTVLELGGSDPFIVMPSADLDAAVEAAVISRTRNNGQSCIAAKRMIVHEVIYDEFRAKYLKALHGLNLGDPLDKETDIGPLVSQKALEDAQLMVNNAVSQGAEYTASIQTLPDTGFYMVPGILENVHSGMWIHSQEIFSPTAMFFKVADINEAIALANDTQFGLSSVMYSNNPAEIDLAVLKIEAGSTFINRYASSDIRLPFGGVKRSGYGREMARAGLLEFTNLKTVIIAN